MSGRLTERQRALQRLIDILLDLKSQMCGLGIPLFAAFENIGKESISGVWSSIFLDCSSIMREQHLDAGTAWKESILKNKERLPLDDGDWDDLSDFGEMLGKSDRHNQEAVLDIEKDKLAILEKKARNAMETKGKLYRNIGVLSGAAVVILLI
jgi:stage III sporulation protein AB